jgi:hypothetical protein
MDTATPSWLQDGCGSLFARRKITEIDEQIAIARKMKRLLANADRCKGLDLENCGFVFLAHKLLH